MSLITQCPECLGFAEFCSCDEEWGKGKSNEPKEILDIHKHSDEGLVGNSFRQL